MSEERKTFSDIFEQMLPYYLFIGMSEEQYWEHSPYLAKAYREKHLLETQARNEELWLQGLYFYDALLASLSGLFSKKGEKGKSYMDKPLRITAKTEAEKRQEKEEARRKAIAYFDSWKANFDAKKATNRW